MARIIAIGDIHGHSKALRNLLDAISPTAEDEFVFLGDLIDRGPDSKGVCDTVIELAGEHLVHTVMGNHEEFAISATLGRGMLKDWLKFGGAEALQSWGVFPLTATPDDVKKLVPPEHWRLFANMVDYHETDDHVFVHACYSPSRTMAEQTSTDLRWTKLTGEIAPLYNRDGTYRTVWCGHTPNPKVRDLGHVVCIDTGMGVFPNGYLTAVDVLTRKFWHADDSGTVSR